MTHSKLYMCGFDSFNIIYASSPRLFVRREACDNFATFIHRSNLMSQGVATRAKAQPTLKNITFVNYTQIYMVSNVTCFGSSIIDETMVCDKIKMQCEHLVGHSESVSLLKLSINTLAFNLFECISAYMYL